MNHHPKTIVISFDGLGTADWEIIEKLPGFARFLKEAAYCKTVRTVYPSLTYPAHCSIVTGLRPVSHRVVHNTLRQPERPESPDWYWKRSYIQGRTIYDAAREKGLKTAAFLWPVTAGAKIHYNIPEIFANRKWDNQILCSLRSGSKKLQIEVFARYGKLMKGIEQPYLDNFIHEAVRYTLKKYEPDLSLIHYVDLDSMRHHYGHDSAQALMALQRHDRRLSELMDLMEGEPVTWVVLGDHSSLDESRAIRLGRLLQRENLPVETQSADGSAYIYADPDCTEDRQELTEQLKTVLWHFSEANGDCIESIITGEEAARLGADGDCLLMLEARLGYYFQDSLEAPDIYEVQPAECLHTPHMQMATHGYSPDKPGYTTVFAMRGPSIQPGEITAPMSLIDEGPTIAHTFGAELPEAEGRLCTEFFREDADGRR